MGKVRHAESKEMYRFDRGVLAAIFFVLTHFTSTGSNMGFNALCFDEDLFA